jgi:hypothetical protein
VVGWWAAEQAEEGAGPRSENGPWLLGRGKMGGRRPARPAG